MQQPQGQNRGPQQERRRVSRKEGERRRLAAAMDVARSRGQLAEGVFASTDASRFSPGPPESLSSAPLSALPVPGLLAGRAPSRCPRLQPLPLISALMPT